MTVERKLHLVQCVADIGIYMFTSPSGGVYVGSSRRLKKRKSRHLTELRGGYHHCDALQQAYKKYDGNLSYSVLETCYEHRLVEREQYWLDLMAACGTKMYNSRMDAANRQRAATEEEKEVLRRHMTGKKHPEHIKQKMRKPKSAEHAAAISAGKKGVATVEYTPELRQKRREQMSSQWANGSRDHVKAKIKAGWNDERRAKQTAAFQRRAVRLQMEMLDWIMDGLWKPQQVRML